MGHKYYYLEVRTIWGYFLQQVRGIQEFFLKIRTFIFLCSKINIYFFLSLMGANSDRMVIKITIWVLEKFRGCFLQQGRGIQEHILEN